MPPRPRCTGIEVQGMRRGTASSEKDRLDAILKRKAEEGVSIYIMLWNEPPSLMDNMCALPLPRAPLHAAGSVPLAPCTRGGRG